MLSGGKHAARKLKRAQILLAAYIGSRDEEIAWTVRVSASNVYRTKRRFVEGNLDRALSEEPRPGAERKLTGKEEALLVATACAKPPAGRRRWTLALLADVMVELTDQDSLSGETVRRRLADNDLKPWRRDMWCIPHVDGEYVARMEDVLDLYAEAPDPERPLVCFDETPVQLIGEVRQPIPPEPGKRALRLRVPPQRHRQSLRRLRPASGLAQGQSHRTAHRRGLCSLHARTRRCPLPQQAFIEFLVAGSAKTGTAGVDGGRMRSDVAQNHIGKAPPQHRPDLRDFAPRSQAVVEIGGYPASAMSG